MGSEGENGGEMGKLIEFPGTSSKDPKEPAGDIEAEQRSTLAKVVKEQLDDLLHSRQTVEIELRDHGKAVVLDVPGREDRQSDAVMVMLGLPHASVFEVYAVRDGRLYASLTEKPRPRLPIQQLHEEQWVMHLLRSLDQPEGPGDEWKELDLGESYSLVHHLGVVLPRPS